MGGRSESARSCVLQGPRRRRLDIGIGIAQRPGDGVLAKNQEEGWMSYWQPADRDRGNIGCAIVIPGKIQAFATESATLPKPTQADLTSPSSEGLPPVANLLATSAAQAGNPFLYCFGAGWSKSGDFPKETDWENYLRQFVARLCAPLKVTLEMNRSLSRQAEGSAHACVTDWVNRCVETNEGGHLL